MKFRYRIITVTCFAIAMGFFEGVVVVYLREILYPDGFQFPLAPIPSELAITELLREAATMIMLITVGILAARRFSTGFAWFIYAFAIWDIFYYIFLKLILGWPESFLTWDILFLIPTTWTGPVLSPVIVSCTMILLALVILIQAEHGKDTTILRREWAGLVAGSLVLIVGFVYDYSQHMLANLSFSEMWQIKDPEVMEVAMRYYPSRFPWWIFGTGEAFLLITVYFYGRRMSIQDTMQE